MPLHASWVHGNALTVEDPSALERDGHNGWGRDLAFVPGKASWLHIPLPTPVIVADKRTTVQRFFLLFKAESCEIRDVHIFDGSSKVQEIGGLHAVRQVAVVALETHDAVRQAGLFDGFLGNPRLNRAQRDACAANGG